MSNSAPDFWWESVTGPATVVSEVAAQLAEANCVALRLPHHVPWLDTFRGSLTESLRRQELTRSLVIEHISALEEGGPSTVLPSFALEEERLSWRPYRENLSDFLERTKALRGRLIWVRDLCAEEALNWAEACKSLRPNSPSDGLVLLECPDLHVPGLPEVRYRNLVSEYSCRLFCAYLADSVLPPSASDARKDYTAALVSRLCAGNPELATRLSEHYYPGRDEPTDALLRTGIDSEEILSRANTHIWEAQLECLFPLVEAERLRIVDRHAAQLDELCKNGLTNSFDEVVNSREELEIGTLFWLTGGNCPPELRLRNCSPEERGTICLLRECRNKLAHRQMVGEDIVRRLVD